MGDDFQAKSEAFMAWLANSTATVNNKIALRDLRELDAGRGVIAVADIAEDELLFSIPRSSILSVENSALVNKLPAIFEDLDPWFSLILVMIYEYIQGNKSSWKSYFDILPTEFDTLMFWTEDELAELQASAVRGKVGKEEADKSLSETVIPIIRSHEDVFFPIDSQAKQLLSDLDLLALAHRMGSTIMAYAFDIEPAQTSKMTDEEGYASDEEDEALPKGMVPLADMLNADADRNNARLFYERDILIMKALKPIKSGGEIFNDYGPLPRSDLLRRYGYITDNYARYDVVELPFEVVRKVVESVAQIKPSIVDDRLEYLDEQGVIDSGYDISIQDYQQDIIEHMSPELVILIEAILLPQAEFDRLKSKGKLPKADKLTVQGAKVLLRLIRARIAQYATTYEEDAGDISNSMDCRGPVFRSEKRKRMAKQVRTGEKWILKEADRALSVVIEETAKTNEGFAKRNENSPQTGPNKKRRVA
ncbi:SET domain-containing protein [Lepidopterella palustris CBS 459.81]|uniref:SET domain-containing protein n=1 Tax=Lepidopterella palustris CBS 459.81 TaxID=1314670 RepID=A0A8E2EIT5_9PEZI|nr:SET domain-containing protein [Lepidopterella palustris CBS 459.81]